MQLPRQSIAKDSQCGDAPLFRDDAAAFRTAAKLGSARIVHSLSTTALTLALTVIVVAAGAFVAYGQYARKESVDGFLEPDRGVIRVFPQRGGVIGDVRVTAGESVERDDVLFNVSDLQSLADGSDVDGEVLIRFGNERAALATAREREARRFDAERGGLTAQRATLEQQIDEVGQLIDVQSEQSALADQQLDALGHLHDRGAMPTVEWLARREAHLQVREKLATSRQLRKRLVGEVASLAARLAQAPIEHTERLAELDSRLSSLERSELAVRAHRDFDVRSPVAGRIVTVQRKVGEPASPSDFALTIIPNDSTLVGRLLIPSSAIGFVAPGQQVRMRFDAFPYQHFGVHPGTLREVARGVLFSGDEYGPLRVTKPAYPATVALLSQTMAAGERDVALQSGMLFKADIILEKRSILEWLVQPLLAMRGRA